MSLHASDWTEDINLEAHGFVSFGYIQTGKNNWLGDSTTDGSTEMTEMGFNLIARPADHWRVGLQLFARDLVDYDNGKPQLDWAYVDYRHNDELGVQAGRVKFPLGLHNEAWDIDAARASVFLPRSVYDLRLRDLLISVDGAKVYGKTDDFQYIAYVGNKTMDEEAGFGTFFERATKFATDSIDVSFVAGGMCAWHKDQLELRLSYWHMNGFEVRGTLPSPTVSNHLNIDYNMYIASAVYELDDWTLNSEVSFRRGIGSVSVGPPINVNQNYDAQRRGAYVNGTWHIHPELDLYCAAEYLFIDFLGLPETSTEYSAVMAAAYRPLENWSVKAEMQYVDGDVDPLSGENPNGLNSNWWIFALKTTVDF